MSDARFSGMLVPALTPFGPDLAPDATRFIGLCKALLEEGANGLAVFGTTSEANSMSARERAELLDALLGAGVPAAGLMPGVGATSLTEAAENTARCIEAGCGGVLMLPPFYYKGVSDDGLFAFYSEVIDRAGRAGTPRVYLYHMPPQAVVGISHDLIERLVAAFPGVVVGIKDSSGDWENTRAMLERFDDFDVFCGSEDFLLATLRNGGRGCITATGNINPGAVAELARTWQEPGADEKQERLTAVRKAVSRTSTIPTMKRYFAHRTGHEGWARMRPPLVSVEAAEMTQLDADLERLGYDPGRIYQAT